MALTVLLTLPTSASGEDWPSYGGGPLRSLAFDSDPGRSIGTAWSSTFASATQQCVAVRGGQVYAVATDPEDPGLSRVHAVSVSDGTIAWTSPAFRGAADPNCAAVDADRVYVARGDEAGPPAGAGILALNRDDGTVAWDSSIAGRGPSSPPVVAGNGVYFSGSIAGGEGRHFALDADDGEPRWDVEGDQTESPPVVVDGAVIQGARGFTGIKAMAEADGATLWSDPDAASTLGTRALEEPGEPATVYYAQTPSPHVVAREALSGDELWTYDAGSGRTARVIAVDQQRVYVNVGFKFIESPDRLVALNRASGAPVWTTARNDRESSRPAGRFGGAVYVHDEAFDAVTGAKLGNTQGFTEIDTQVGSAPLAAYADGSFFQWAQVSGLFRLVALRDVVAPQADVTQPAAGIQTRRPRPQFSWTADDGIGSGLDRIEFRLDGGAPTVLGANATGYQPAADLPDGEHIAEVRFIDRRGNTTTREREFTVDTSPTPIAAIAVTPPIGLTDDPVTFDASASRDTDFEGSIVRYEWDIDGDGTFERDSGAESVIEHAYPAPFSGQVAVRVTNDSGFSAVAFGAVDVRPAPPRGVVGLSINAGAVATNEPTVQLSLVWPARASQVGISNDGGFGSGTVLRALTPTTEWRLAESGAERLPKLVYARYLGAGTDGVTFIDDIILDQRPPTVDDATLLEGNAGSSRAAKRYRIALTAKDDNSGLVLAELASKKRGGASARIKLADSNELGDRRVKKKLYATLSFVPKFIRVRDAGGNYSGFRRLATKPHR